VPELAEVESLAQYLTSVGRGLEVARVDITSFSVLKTYDPPVSGLVGLSLESVGRRGKYLLCSFPPLWLVLHLSRGGWIRWVEALKPGPVKPGKGPLQLRVAFTSGAGFDMTEAGTEKRTAAWVVKDPLDIEQVATLGPEVLSPELTEETFASLLAATGRSQIKHALTDQRLIAGVGNAYSDEALHMAHLSPFKPAGNLGADEVSRLYASLVSVLQEALTRSEGVGAAGLKNEKKSGLRVHGRAGQACPECGDTVREVAFSGKSLQYCPTCQTGGKPLADRRYSKFLK